jgi:iron uptake system EfeUOB component EfeO/EfeM
MIKLKSFVAVTALVTVLTLTGCSSNKAEQQNTQVKEQPKVEETQKTLTISQGTQNMIDALNKMKERLEAKDEAAVITEGSKLEENWKPIEDAVKDKNKEVYSKVEEPLDAVNAGIKIKPLDTKALGKNIEELKEQLEQVLKIDQPQLTESKKDLTIEDGAKNMRNALKNMKEMIVAKNEAGAIKESSKLEQNWKPIEDSVKDKNKDLYEKVETPLGIINAAIKIKPLDTKTLTSAIDSLDNILSEVQKIK